ncbi:predicted protein [Botrytis cinerea T4]|uniref:Uncharacterized protein n=1 Tax=Botryotinia fuckeliana (strain T4) TaxID=999810 RepID=G2Y622_BOTF4|nr:predicted protein [Botrytis cinerea T4]
MTSTQGRKPVKGESKSVAVFPRASLKAKQDDRDLVNGRTNGFTGPGTRASD